MSWDVDQDLQDADDRRRYKANATQLRRLRRALSDAHAIDEHESIDAAVARLVEHRRAYTIAITWRAVPIFVLTLVSVVSIAVGFAGAALWWWAAW